MIPNNMSGTESINIKRRKNLLRLFLFLLVVAIVFIWIIFSGYSNSSGVKKEHYLIHVNLNKLMPGEVRIIRHNGSPVILMRRSQQDLKNLLAIRSNLIDPDSQISSQPRFAKNYYRSLKQEYFIAYAINPVSGVEVNYKSELDIDVPWYGGFLENRTDDIYDKAGRIYKRNSGADPLRSNLYIPNYKITPDNQLYVYTLKELDFD